MPQLDLFAAPPAPLSCPLHDDHHVCGSCPQLYDEDHSGFVHRLDCAGRIPLRPCQHCGELRSPGRWNHRDWYHCVECVPLGWMSDMGAARSPHPTDPKKIVRWP